jgi:hypothetical protein
MVPVPEVVIEHPVPQTMAAVVFVELVIPLKGTLVAAIVPEPLTPRLAPVPTSIAAVELVALVIAENATALPHASHSNPVVCPLWAVKHCPFEPTPSRAFTVVKVKRSPFVVSGLTVAPPPPSEMLKVRFVGLPICTVY